MISVKTNGPFINLSFTKNEFTCVKWLKEKKRIINTFFFSEATNKKKSKQGIKNEKTYKSYKLKQPCS